MTNHEANHSSVSPKLAIGVFCVFMLIAFLYLRFFATYDSGDTYVATNSAVDPNNGLVISPAAPRFSSFSFPDDKVVFEYPVEWFLTQKSETLWEIKDIDATTEAALTMTIEVKEASSSAEELIGCTKCEKIEINKAQFAKKKETDTEDKVTYAMATILENKGYTITAIYPNAAAELSAQVQQLFDSIIVQD
jgi:hypothetical protein